VPRAEPIAKPAELEIPNGSSLLADFFVPGIAHDEAALPEPERLRLWSTHRTPRRTC